MSMKKIVLLSLLLTFSFAQEAVEITASNSTATNAGSEEALMKEKFERFMRRWKKTYSSPEEQAKRFHIFRHNCKMAMEMSKATNQTTYGITKFFDMEYTEFQKNYGGLTLDFVEMMRAEVEFEDYSDGAMEKTVVLSQEVPQTDDATLRHLEETKNHAYSDADDYESEDPDDDPNWDMPEPFGIKTITDVPKASNLKQSVPPNWDWRAQGAVSYVRNQGTCGACWAFTTVANIEGLYFNKNKRMKVLSEQQLLDCNTNNGGCSGGTLPLAFTYVKNAKGIMLRNKYPYTGQQAGCRAGTDEQFGEIKGYVSPGMDEIAIKNMIFNKGPVSAAINSAPLYYYRGGIYDPSQADCNPYGVNHGVTIVGYGSQDGVDYWIIKNSWGPNWGEKGYFRIRRGTGACGINRMVYSGVLA
jgi:C1A family cysteine protease